MTILVTGANGFVGNLLIRDLLKSQYEVVGAVRSAAHGDTDVKMFPVGDIDAVTDWSVALDKVNVVVHLAARVHVMNDTVVDPLAEFRKINVDGSLNLAKKAAAAGVKRFIFISSVKVNGERTAAGKPFTETDVTNPQDAYAVSKFEAEQSLFAIAKQTGMEVVIIRPPLVYGPGVKANFASMMRAVKRGIPLPLGAIHNKRSFVYIGNLVSLIVRCVEHRAAANQVFLVSDGHDLSTTELLRACATALQVKPRLLYIPQMLLEVVATIFGKRDMSQRLCGNLQVDITKARNILGWSPPTSVADGLRATAQSLSEMGRE